MRGKCLEATCYSEPAVRKSQVFLQFQLQTPFLPAAKQRPAVHPSLKAMSGCSHLQPE